MAKNNRNRTIGSTVPELKGKEVHKETLEFITKQFEKGDFHFCFGAGATSNHIAYDLFTPLSLCGRNIGKISSKPILTPLGRMCLGCKKVYEEAFLAWFKDRKQEISTNAALAKELRETISNVENLMNTNRKWSLALMGFKS